MVNPSLIFTIIILVVITLLFFIAIFKGWIGNNPFVLPALLVFTVWGFALWLLVAYAYEWTPYRITNRDKTTSFQTNRDYNQELFHISLIVFIITTIAFAVLLLFAFAHAHKRKKRINPPLINPSLINPFLINPSLINPSSINPPPTNLPMGNPPDIQNPIINSVPRPIFNSHLDRQLGTASSPAAYSMSRLATYPHLDRQLGTASRPTINSPVDSRSRRALFGSDTVGTPTTTTQSLAQQIDPVTGTESAREMNDRAGIPETSGVRISAAAQRQIQAALKTPTPSAYMFGKKGADIRMG